MASTLETDLSSRRETRLLAEALGRVLRPGDLVLLSGPLGAGKTFFTRAVLRSRGVDRAVRITSPTYALVCTYEGISPMVHADLYRVETEAEVEPLGLSEARAQGALLIVEWGDPFKRALGGDPIVIHLAVDVSGFRRIVATAEGEVPRARLEEWRAEWQARLRGDERRTRRAKSVGNSKTGPSIGSAPPKAGLE